MPLRKALNSNCFCKSLWRRTSAKWQKIKALVHTSDHSLTYIFPTTAGLVLVVFLQPVVQPQCRNIWKESKRSDWTSQSGLWCEEDDHTRKRATVQLGWSVTHWHLSQSEEQGNLRVLHTTGNFIYRGHMRWMWFYPHTLVHLERDWRGSDLSRQKTCPVP